MRIDEPVSINVHHNWEVSQLIKSPLLVNFILEKVGEENTWDRSALILSTSFLLTHSEFLNQLIRGDFVLIDEVLKSSDKLVKGIVVSVWNIVHFIDEFCVVDSASFVFLKEFDEFLDWGFIDWRQGFHQGSLHFKDSKSTIKFRIIFVKSLSQRVLVFLVIYLCIHSLKHSVSKVHSFKLISNKVLKHHLNLNFVLTILHLLGHSSKLLICKCWIKDSHASVEGGKIYSIVPYSETHLVKKLIWVNSWWFYNFSNEGERVGRVFINLVRPLLKINESVFVLVEVLE